METLFARKAPRRGTVVLMLAGSLVFHGALVGIGALFVQPLPPVEFEPWVGPEATGGPTPIYPSETPMVESGPTATPEALEPTIATPPPLDEPSFAEPAMPTPRQKTVSKPTTVTRTNNSARPAAPATASSGNGLANGTSMAPGTTASWYMPHPPYPAARLSAGTGVTTVRIITDAGGRVASTVILRSTGNPILDAHTVMYVRENWRGPANSSRTTEFVYQLR